MGTNDYESLKAKFLKMYANVPLPLRNEIIVVIDNDKTLTWSTANLEIIHDTENAKKILEKLKNIGII